MRLAIPLSANDPRVTSVFLDTRSVTNPTLSVMSPTDVGAGMIPGSMTEVQVLTPTAPLVRHRNVRHVSRDMSSIPLRSFYSDTVFVLRTSLRAVRNEHYLTSVSRRQCRGSEYRRASVADRSASREGSPTQICSLQNRAGSLLTGTNLGIIHD